MPTRNTANATAQTTINARSRLRTILNLRMAESAVSGRSERMLRAYGRASEVTRNTVPKGRCKLRARVNRAGAASASRRALLVLHTRIGWRRIGGMQGNEI